MIQGMVLSAVIAGTALVATKLISNQKMTLRGTETRDNIEQLHDLVYSIVQDRNHCKATLAVNGITSSATSPVVLTQITTMNPNSTPTAAIEVNNGSTYDASKIYMNGNVIVKDMRIFFGPVSTPTVPTTLADNTEAFLRVNYNRFAGGKGGDNNLRTKIGFGGKDITKWIRMKIQRNSSLGFTCYGTQITDAYTGGNSDLSKEFCDSFAFFTWDAANNICIPKNNICPNGTVFTGMNATGYADCTPFISFASQFINSATTYCDPSEAYNVRVIKDGTGKRVQVHCGYDTAPTYSCPTVTKNWNISSSVCTATITSVTSGNNATATDSTAPTTGSAQYYCNISTWEPIGMPTCVGGGIICPATTVNWSRDQYNCTGTLPEAMDGGNHASIDSTSDQQGTGNYLCTLGTWGMTSRTCAGTDSWTYCFVADSSIEMANGETKKIQDIQVGDLVLSRNDRTGLMEGKKVEKLFHHPEKAATLYTLHLSNGEKVTSNDIHPYYLPSEKKYVIASELAAYFNRGDSVQFLGNDGKLVHLLKVETKEKSVKLYNFSVEDNHNFFASGILVHNKNDDGQNYCATQSGAICSGSAGNNISCSGTPAEHTVFNNCMAGKCPGRDVVWTQGPDTCSSYVASGLTSDTATINDSTGPMTGSANMVCSGGVWNTSSSGCNSLGINGRCSCQTTTVYGGGGCGGGAYSPGDNNSCDLTNTWVNQTACETNHGCTGNPCGTRTQFNGGGIVGPSATLNCYWVNTGGGSVCQATTANWTNTQYNCSASLPAGAAGAGASVTDNVGDQQGAATFTCSALGSWDSTSTSCAGTNTWTYCFVGDSPIDLANGTTKKIQDIKLGDVVLSRNDQTGKIEGKPVTELFHHPKNAATLYSLKLSNGTTLTSNDIHPYFIPELDSYLNANELVSRFKSGNEVEFMGANGKMVTLLDVETEDQEVELYNFTVEDNHNYFAGGILVHNKNDDGQNYCATQSGAACTGSPGNNISCAGTNAQRTVYDSCMAGTCPGRNVVWTQDVDTCSSYVAAGLTGQTTTITDSGAPMTGTANMSCGGGTWNVSSSSCATTTCPVSTINWSQGGTPCSATSPSGTGTRTVTDSNVPHTGSATIVCSAGTWFLSGASSCTPSACPAQTLNWSQSGNNCSANIGSGLATTSITDSTDPYRGSASYNCTSGSWTVTGTPTCVDYTCPAQTLNWSQGGDNCEASIAAGLSTTTITDSIAPTTGSASYNCSSGTWTVTGSPSCSAGTGDTCTCTAGAVYGDAFCANPPAAPADNQGCDATGYYPNQAACQAASGCMTNVCGTTLWFGGPAGAAVIGGCTWGY